MLNGALASLRRSDDRAGVLVVGGVLTLLTWTVMPLWAAASVALPPLVVLAPLALAPAFVARGYFVRVLADAAKTGNTDGAPPFVAWNELYRSGAKSAALSAILLAPLALLFAVVAVAGVALGTQLGGVSAVAEPAERTLGTGGAAAVVALGAERSRWSRARTSSRSRTCDRRRSPRSPPPDDSATASVRSGSVASPALGRTRPRGSSLR